ncbi:MAG TPA: hypothetical protein VL979_06415 [Solirubrobacteraceae bacterium]|nr:hypothetical protein [Solirubrobacteraceae bacterium]
MSTAQHPSTGSQRTLALAPESGERAQYLQLQDCDLFCVYHPPRDGSPTQAVLLCPPFGWEEVCSYRSRRLLAQMLAGAGYPTVRIDLPGGGDSRDPRRRRAGLESWSSATDACARWLRRESGAPLVTAIGIGLGGLVVCRALGLGAELDQIALWNVPSRGRAFVRELRAFARLEQAAVALAGEDPGERRASSQGAPERDAPAAALEAGGFGLDAATVDELEAFDVEQLPHELGLRRALLLARDGVSGGDRMRAELVQRGADVSEAPGQGYSQMVAEPQLARAPLATFDLMLAWLREGSTATASPGRTGAPAPRSGAAHAPTATPASERDGVRERPLAVQSAAGALFGILAEPLEREPERLAVVLLNAGAIRRIGPSRLWVELARAWASRGICTMRLDFEGIGDSCGERERSPDLPGLYAGELAGQVRAAVDHVELATGAQRFVLAGLCSGAYWSFHAALQDDRVSAALLVNPQTLFWDPAQAAGRDLRHTLLQASSWRRLLSGQSNRERVAQLVRALGPGALDALRRALARLRSRAGGGGEQLELALRRMHAGRKRVLFAFSGDEPLYEQMRSDGALARIREWPNVQLARLAGSDHTLRPPAARRDAARVLGQALERELAPAAPAPGDR